MLIVCTHLRTNQQSKESSKWNVLFAFKAPKVPLTDRNHHVRRDRFLSVDLSRANSCKGVCSLNSLTVNLCTLAMEEFPQTCSSLTQFFRNTICENVHNTFYGTALEKICNDGFCKALLSLSTLMGLAVFIGFFSCLFSTI